MAGKAKSARKPSPKRASDKDIVDGALRLIADRGWRNVGLSDVAGACGVPLADMYDRFPNMAALVRAFLKDVDRQTLAAPADFVEQDSPRDRLFDVVMKRFDVLAGHKDGVAAVFRGSCRDPLVLACLAPDLARSMAWMLEAAGISSTGIRGRMRVRGLGLVYAKAFRAWLGDDTDDLAKTMAALDKGLVKAEQLAGLPIMGGT